VAAIIGKQVCGFCALEKGLNRIAIGIAMIPRGEVTLIFAGIGKSQGIINDVVFSALIIMVIITTRLHRQLSGWQCPKDLPQRRIKTELSYS
jgi:Kef-type K+ transport system membrane component KefB